MKKGKKGISKKNTNLEKDLVEMKAIREEKKRHSVTCRE